MEAKCVSLRWLLLGCVLVLMAFGHADAFDWTEPAPLTEINTIYHEKAPFLSFDGLTLYFSRETPWQYTHLYEAMRETPDGPFVAVRQISALNYGYGHVDCPWVSPDNLRMYYYRTEITGKRLKLTRRPSLHAFWLPGSDIEELNELGDVANPSLTKDERIIVFSGYHHPGGRGGWDLWEARRPDREARFGDIRNLSSVNSRSWDMHPCIASNGLTLYFASDRNGVFQLFKSTRLSADGSFGEPELLSTFDTPDGDSQYPRLSADGRTFLFARHEKGRAMDLYVSYRIGSATGRVDLVRRDEVDGTPQVVMTFTTVQEAIDAAQDGDAVNIHPAVYQEGIDFGGKMITVQSAGDAAILEAPDGMAVSFCRAEGPGSILRNLVIRGSRVGVWVLNSAPTISNLTVVDNDFGVDASGDSAPLVGNSIFWGNAVSDLHGCGATYSCIERGGAGEGNFSGDPLFVDPDNGDYHVRSERGRYWPAHDIWVLDDVTSPCVDAGDPLADFSDEREPNGGRLNIGAHGGTPFAALSE